MILKYEREQYCMRHNINELIETMTLRQKLGQLIVSRPMAEGIEENVAKGEIGGLYVTNKIDTLAKLKEISPFPVSPFLHTCLRCCSFVIPEGSPWIAC